jgi:sphingosine kinase
VLVNPFGGQGYAEKSWTKDIEPIFAAANCIVDVERTKYRGHAVEIVENLDIDAYDVVACASGDGLPHEVFNGLAKHKTPKLALRKIAVVQLPCGSGNAMSLNLNGTDSPSLAALEIVKGMRTPLDLIAITQGDERFYSFLSQAVGIIAETDLGTESLRWMGGFRFTWGILVRLLGKTIYPAEVSLVVDTDDKRTIKETYRRVAEEHEAARAKNLRRETYEEDLAAGDDAELPELQFGTVIEPLQSCFTTQDVANLGNFYVGNMCYMSADAPFFTATLPSDGKMDLVIAPGDMARMTAIRMLTTVEQGTLINFPEISYTKVLAYRITPRMAPTPSQKRIRSKIGRWLGGASHQKEGLISIDGEQIPFRPFQAEVVPKLGTVLSKSGAIYEIGGLAPL